MDKHLKVPFTADEAAALRAGDMVYLTGVVYTARDAAHKRMNDALDRGEQLPVDLSGNVVYYLGPTPARPGRVIGSAGPTTASRMDKYAPRLLDLGLRGMIGKGKRTQAVLDAMKAHKAVYFGATGGTAVLLADCVKSEEAIAYEDLGPEAVLRLEVKDMPLTVIADCHGGNLYETGPEEARKLI